MTKKLTEREAAEKWVNEFNAIESTLLEKIIKCDPDSFREITPLAVGDYVYIDSHYTSGEIEDIDYSNEQVVIEGNTYNFDDVYKEEYGGLPMWGTLWTFGERLDEDWARENLEVMAQCGFRIYEFEDTGTLYYGIDGCGYNFYDAHWIPLYKARGLKWHSVSA